MRESPSAARHEFPTARAYMLVHSCDHKLPKVNADGCVCRLYISAIVDNSFHECIVKEEGCGKCFEVSRVNKQ